MRTTLPAMFCGALALCACDKPEPTPAKPAPSAPASALAMPSASASAAPAVDEAKWFVGKWTGSYEAQAYAIELKKGEGLKQWGGDADTDGAGEGKLTLDVAADGAITGSASGPLGDMIASGEVDAETFSVQLKPKEPTETAFQGFFVAKREGAALKGRLQASSGDSIKVRDAPVQLGKAK